MKQDIPESQNTLVGRSSELRAINAALGSAAGGQGRIVFLSGPAGIGKTSLAREALARARSSNFLALEGRAYPLEGGLAYGLILDAFGPFLRGLDGPRLARLANSLPDLGRLFAGLNLPAPGPMADPALEKSRLFEAMARLIELLGGEAPLALLLDDIHWADPASLEMLHYIGRSLGDQRVLILATYRDDEADAARGLRPLLKSLQRNGLAEELKTSRLENEGILELAERILGAPPPAGLNALLVTRAAGIPLYVQALIRALIDANQLTRENGGWKLGPDAALVLPTAVRDLILERLEQLDSTTRRIVDLVAVSGDSASYPVLHTASGLSDDILLRTLQVLISAGLLAEESSEAHVHYRFTHPMMQEVAYGALTEMARRRAHAAMAAAIEQLHPEDIDRLARHYMSAGAGVDRSRTLEVLLAACERSWGLSAFEETARYVASALALVREGHRPRSTTGQPEHLLPALLERLGDAWDRIGEGIAAIEVWKEALAEYTSASNNHGLARVHCSLGISEWNRGHFAEAQAHINSGLEALAGQPLAREMVDLHLARLDFVRRLGNLERIAEVTEELSTLGERAGLPHLKAAADLVRVIPMMAQGELTRALEHALKLLDTLATIDEPMLVIGAHYYTAMISITLGLHAQARQHAEAATQVARDMRVVSLEIRPRITLAFAEIQAGNWDRALEISAEWIAIARRVSPPRELMAVLAVRAIALAQAGDLVEASACIAAAREAMVASPANDHIFSVIDQAETLIAIEQEDVQRVISSAARLATHRPYTYTATLFLEIRGEALIIAGDTDGALRIASKLRSLDHSASIYPVALAARIEGLARRSQGKVEAALGCLEQATGTFDDLSIPFDAARARLEWASLAAIADRAEAVTRAQSALEAFQRLGARRYEERARQLLQRLGIRPRPPRRAKAHSGILSERELEVARLVAEGLTTPEIARRLVVSPRTVSAHLDRLYTRLGINSRSALARYVIEAGLLESERRD